MCIVCVGGMIGGMHLEDRGVTVYSIRFMAADVAGGAVICYLLVYIRYT